MRTKKTILILIGLLILSIFIIGQRCIIVTPTDKIVISDKQGFDKCEAATPEQLQTWWNNSPYWDVNIYIGGISRACSNKSLDSSWISTVSAQGWNFIPTWVGPQAPCSSYRHKISYDLSSAYNEGRAEADSAYQVAVNLGLTVPQGGGTIIYYDMEAYNTANSACQEAVKSFISGWVGRLKELGNRAGVYGSTCGSAASGWASIENVPDDVWLAAWDSKSYNPNATVWGLPCVPDSYWPNHQRIHQYAGGHNETWGGLTLNIDCDISDGHLAGTNEHGASKTGIALNSSLTTTPTSNYLTFNEETRFLDFLDSQNGTLVVKLPTSSNFSKGLLFRTEDGGKSWKELSLPIGEEVRFIDTKKGFVAGGVEGNELYITRNGGETWEFLEVVPKNIEEKFFYTLPKFDNLKDGVLPVTFVNYHHNRIEFYITEDGGETWKSDLSIPFETNIELGTNIPISIIDTKNFVFANPDKNQIYFITKTNDKNYNIEVHNFTQSIIKDIPVTITEVDFQSINVGTIKITSSVCTGDKVRDSIKTSKPFKCELYTKFLHTNNKGKKWEEKKIK